jgi:hypothetical protein
VYGACAPGGFQVRPESGCDECLLHSWTDFAALPVVCTERRAHARLIVSFELPTP